MKYNPGEICKRIWEGKDPNDGYRSKLGDEKKRFAKHREITE